MLASQTHVAQLKQTVIEKYEDILDTILVIEAMKDTDDKGTNWKTLKGKMAKHV